MTFLDILLAFLLPPLVVAIRTGSLGKTLISVLLLLLGWIPAVIYALWVVSHARRRTS